MKIALEEVEAVLLEKKIEPKKVSEIIRALEEIAEEVKEATKEEALDADGLPTDAGADAGEKPKWENVIVIHDKNDLLKGQEIAGWIVQQHENEDAGTILSRLIDCAKNQNEGARKKKNAITNFVELFEGLKSKFTKEKNLKIKTKDLTRVLITSGKFMVNTPEIPIDKDVDTGVDVEMS
jgi:NAD-dependent SIR2 family protein deacetylase